MQLKASVSNDIKHEHTLHPKKKQKHGKSANSVSAINLSSTSSSNSSHSSSGKKAKNNAHGDGKKKSVHRHATETEKMRTAITQLNLFGNEASESLQLLEALKSTN